MGNCNNCAQNVRNDEQDRRLTVLEKTQKDKVRDIAQLQQALCDREKANGMLIETDQKLDQKIDQTEQGIEDRVNTRLNSFEKKLTDMNTTFDEKLSKLDQKMWGFLIAVLLLVVGVIFKGS